MDINTLKAVGTQIFGHGIIVGRKYSPEILTAVGVVGFISSAVMASKSTLNLDKTLDDAKFEIDIVREQKTLQGGTHPDIQYNKDLTRAYVGLTVDLARLYGPAVTLSLGSTACVIGAHGIMQRRNVALVAAYKTIETAFGQYRKRVIEDLGLDKDRDYRFGVKTEEVEDEKGKKSLVRSTTESPEALGYARYFTNKNDNWNNSSSDINFFFLKMQQNYLNDLLHSRGHVFLNEAYDRLGFERTPAGAVVGWVITDDESGDNFVDFGLYNLDGILPDYDFTHMDKTRIMVDFNVDGVIWDKI